MADRQGNSIAHARDSIAHARKSIAHAQVDCMLRCGSIGFFVALDRLLLSPHPELAASGVVSPCMISAGVVGTIAGPAQNCHSARSRTDDDGRRLALYFFTIASFFCAV